MNTSDFKWLDKKEYPFSSEYHEINNCRQHYIDVGEGEVLLFVHGTPSWSFDFRNVIRNLSPHYRCVAPDHIGFGLSDKPEHYDYSTVNHSRTLSSFIDHLQLKNISLVLHDFGGPIGFNYALNHPDNIKRVIILNSWLWSSLQNPDFIKLSRILRSPLLPFLYKYLNFSPRFLLPGSFGDKKISKKLLKQYTKPFGKTSERNGPLAFAKSLLNDQAWFEQLWNKRDVLQSKPVLLLWGMKDQFVGPSYLDRFMLGFPSAKVERIEGCGHFPQEEQPEKVWKAIMSFLRS
jgi:pimeloyl-ACP methyl ester carboxylesterase